MPSSAAGAGSGEVEAGPDGVGDVPTVTGAEILFFLWRFFGSIWAEEITEGGVIVVVVTEDAGIFAGSAIGGEVGSG